MPDLVDPVGAIARPAVDEHERRRPCARRRVPELDAVGRRSPPGSSHGLGPDVLVQAEHVVRVPGPLERDQPVVLRVAVDAPDDGLVAGLGHVVDVAAGDALRLGEVDGRARPTRGARRRRPGRPTSTRRRSRTAPTGRRTPSRPRAPGRWRRRRPRSRTTSSPGGEPATWSTNASTSSSGRAVHEPALRVDRGGPSRSDSSFACCDSRYGSARRPPVSGGPEREQRGERPLGVRLGPAKAMLRRRSARRRHGRARSSDASAWPMISDAKRRPAPRANSRKAAKTSRARVGRVHEQAARDRRADRREVELEGGDDPEVRAGAAHAPEQVRRARRRWRGRARPSAVTSSTAPQAVDRQPELALEAAHAAAQRQARDARVRDGAGGAREADRLGRVVELAEQRAAVHAGDPPLGIDASRRASARGR